MLGIRNSSGSASMGVDSKVWCLSKINRNVIHLLMAHHRDAAHDGNHWKIKCIF